jgi:hypothetical protein
MRVALLILGLLIVAQPIVHNGRYNHDEGKNTRKIFMVGIAKGSCFSGGVSNVDIDGNNTLQIKFIGAAISTFETLPIICTRRYSRFNIVEVI